MSLRLDILAERQPCTAGRNNSTQGALGAPGSTCAVHEIAITPGGQEGGEEVDDRAEGGKRDGGGQNEGGKSWTGEEGDLPEGYQRASPHVRLNCSRCGRVLFPEPGRRHTEWANGSDPTGQGTGPIKRSGRQTQGFAPTVLQHAGAFSRRLNMVGY